MFNKLKSRDKNKTNRLVVRVSDEEKDYIKNYCKEKKITISEYIYNLICIDITMFKK